MLTYGINQGMGEKLVLTARQYFIFDDMQLRTGDLIGGLLCLAGVVVILAWPQGRAGASGGDTRCSSSTNSSVTGHGTGGTEWVGCANTSASVAGALVQSTV